MFTSVLAGVGHYVPENVVTNAMLAERMPTTGEWIAERTGIECRRYFTEGKDTVSSMGAEAAKLALQRAGIAPGDIDAIVFATITSDYYFPGSGVLMQRLLNCPGIPAIDIKMQCSGFIYALSIADQFIKTGMYKTVLVVGSEVQSNALEFSERDRHMSVIFADGAGAVVLRRAEVQEQAMGVGVMSTHLHSDGRYAEELMMQHPGSVRKNRITEEMLKNGAFLPVMNGQAVFKHAVVRFKEVVEEALAANGFQAKDIDLLIPHQANLRIAKYLQEQLHLSDEKVFNNIQRYGNTTAASIPIAMSEAWEAGLFNKGNLICLAAFGSGFTWASALIKL